MAVENQMPAILCLSHLGWDSIWQRPHHIMSRLGRYCPVLYVNEPEIASVNEPHPYLKRVTRVGQVRAWQPVFPDRPDVLREWRRHYVDVVQELLIRQQWVQMNDGGWFSTRPLLLWFYTPTPYYFLDHIPADVVVYDVMDELVHFKDAANDLPERESKLLSQADIVFAGGRSLYEARQDRHPNVHLFPSGVEPDHFAKARTSTVDIAPQIADVSGPILGYYGAIDERIDLDLIETVAEAHPEWHIVLIGPVVKIERSDLPRRPNIQYTGRQPYTQLPNFLRGFDVCLMPFAMNDATRSISPTKALEYMAAHKPIVSTPVPDVVANWSDAVYIGGTSEEYIAAIERALNETDDERATRERHQREHVQDNTWDTITTAMLWRILPILKRKSAAVTVVEDNMTVTAKSVVRERSYE